MGFFFFERKIIILPSNFYELRFEIELITA
jgi:hypothetical protein